ncbi:hypothetical protein [Catelliglobosispora koreensis]|uniref:hypothetical protein n=1 Tax=Catelliglobosispora koreensis TaxID=129052 RepID=UPI0012F7BF52|nr:hypothetical protein [Catelliglobosispora koreensis]
MLLRRLVEMGECTDAQGILALTVRLYTGAVGAWELEVREPHSGREICQRYETEAIARGAIEAAYEHGRQFGTWRVQRARDYKPTGQ